MAEKTAVTGFRGVPTRLVGFVVAVATGFVLSTFTVKLRSEVSTTTLLDSKRV